MEKEKKLRNMMICEDGFVFRKGKKGDKLPSVSIQRRDENDLPDENDFPDFVLELNNKQVASACGEQNRITMISSVESGKGYCKKFLEMWEKYARENGYSALIISHVDNDALEHILEKKRKFSFWKEDRMSGKYYRKDSSSPDS